jgi:hypothetical protein
MSLGSPTPDVGVLLAGVEPPPAISGGGDKRRARTRTKTPAERGVDSWMSYGEEGIWKRAHRTPRRSLFTPHRVAGGPGRQTIIGGHRTTKGTYVGSGKQFVIVDDYHDPNHAHRILANAWIGTSEFKEMNIENETESDDREILRSEKGRSLMFDEHPRVIGALRSLSARPRAAEAPRKLGQGRALTGDACIESALSPPARASGRMEGSRKFKSYGSRSELYASAMSVNVACPILCRNPISSTAASLGTGNDRGGVRDFIGHLGRREQHHALGRQTYADRDFGAHRATRALTVSRADLAQATNAVRKGCVVSVRALGGSRTQILTSL